MKEKVNGGEKTVLKRGVGQVYACCLCASCVHVYNIVLVLN